MVKHWNESNFEQALSENGVLVVDFWAEWCMPCRMMAPSIDKLAEEFDGRVAVGKVNVDEARALAMDYGIQSIPTVILFKNGEIVSELIGVRPYEELQNAVAALL